MEMVKGFEKCYVCNYIVYGVPGVHQKRHLPKGCIAGKEHTGILHERKVYHILLHKCSYMSVH